jgi:hypothetical protein
MNKKISIIATLFAIVCILMSAMPAHAQVTEDNSQTYGFDTCTVNNPGDVEIGKAQMWVDVVELDGNQVKFHFYNLGPEASSISEIYFDDGALLGIAKIENGPGVLFVQGADPPDLPGGQDCVVPPFNVTAGFLAQSAPPPSDNGVGPGEWVDIYFDLKDSKTFDDVITDLGSGALRIGIHVIGFASGGSESFINEGGTAITLAGFGCAASRQEVTVSWVTGTELNNAGFNLYRSLTPAGPQMKVNGALLRAVGEGVSGASYSFVDRPGYGVFYYWLEDVDYSGRTTLHGPAAVTVKTPYRLPAYRPVIPGSK